VESASGTLRLNGGGNGSGLFQADDNATLEFGNNYHLQLGAILAGSGLVRVAGGTVSTAGPVLVLNLTVAGGTLDLGAPLTATNLELDSGATIKGSGDVLVIGTFDITGGTLSGGNSSVRVLPGGSLNIRQDITFDGRSLSNLGVVTWYGGTITLQNGAGIHNTLTGDLDVQTDSSIQGSGSFVNDAGGRFQKSAGDGTTDIQVDFYNQFRNSKLGQDPLVGFIQARHGTLNFHGHLVKRGIIEYQGGQVVF
jgi:hypothetical protein